MLFPYRVKYNLLIINQGDILGYELTALLGLFQVDSELYNFPTQPIHNQKHS